VGCTTLLYVECVSGFNGEAAGASSGSEPMRQRAATGDASVTVMGVERFVAERF